MQPRTSRGVRWAALGMMVFSISATLLGAASGQEDRQKTIDEIKKQIEELNKQLQAIQAESSKPAESSATAKPLVDPEMLKTLTWRSIGPAAMGGRIVAIAVNEKDPNQYWVATASGGLIKTSNNGITFEHQFDRESTVSIGDVAVAPSDPNIVWVGTGENNPRNSVSYGDGVYKSTDGGKTWKNMGLTKTFQIGRIAVHPTNPEIVYVGALGRLYGPNEDRGLYKTTDGGKTWEKVFFLDDRTGIIDVQLSPKDPETLIVAAYERKRNEFDVGDPEVKFGEKAGLYKSTDGGKSFKRLTQGLPTVKMGRIGIDFFRANGDVVFAIIETEEIGKGPKAPEGKKPGIMGIQGEDAENAARLTRVTAEGPADKAGLKDGDLILSIDGKETKNYQAVVDVLREKFAGDQLKVKAKRGEELLEIEVTMGERPQAGGAGSDRPFGAQLGGQRENAQDQQGEEGYQYGGVYKSTDAGETWTRVNSLNPRPMYFSQVRVDPSDEKYVYVLGVALYRSEDGGKTFRGDAGRNVHADHHEMWINPKDGRHILVGCDGGIYVTYDRTLNWDHLNHMALGQFYHVAVDPRRLYYAYGGLQDNGTWGGPVATKDGSGPVNEDWLRIGGGDGFQCQVDQNEPDLVYFTSQYGALGRRNLRTGEQASIRPRSERGRTYRWNWNTPFRLSAHNSKIYYAAGNYVFKSLDRGNDLRVISPEITRTKEGSATAFGESPVDPNILYVGTDDGKLWVTTDGGVKWEDVTEKLGLPGPRGISSIEPSRFEAGRCYVAVDGHRNDDDNPYLFVTEDSGKSWKAITANLPWGSTRCLREDVKNSELLYCGTEFAIWFSLDRGASWQKLNNNLPTVAIHEIAVHPTAGEIVVATHGRSLWVLDISPLRQMTKEVRKADAHLFAPIPAVRWKRDPGRGGTNRKFVGQNPSGGAVIYYMLTKEAKEASLQIVDAAGRTVRTLRPSRQPGLYRAIWDLQRSFQGGGRTAAPQREPEEAGEGESPASSSGPAQAPAQAIRAQGAASSSRRGGLGGAVPPGTYGIILTVDGKAYSQSIRVEADPSLPTSEVIADDQEEAATNGDMSLEEKELEEIDLDD